MDVTAAFYGLAVLAVFLFVRTGPSRHVHLAATFLMISWFAYNVAIKALPRLDLITNLGLLDFIGAVLALGLYLSRPAWWKAVLAGLFLVQSAAHMAFLAIDPAPAEVYAYRLTLNVLFIAELVTVAAPVAIFHLRRRRARRGGRESILPESESSGESGGAVF